ncbi:MAG: tyramine oxidase, partial [Rubritepida sp.]|nr:tyramine oxidase [Rubritepida sp.]
MDLAAETRIAHPLDPLSLAECGEAARLARAHWPAPGLRFAMLRLEEPPKAEVLALDPATGETRELVFDLAAGTLRRETCLPFEAPPYGQAPVLLEDFMAVERIVKADPAWRAAVMRRGVAEHELDSMQVDPFSAGFFDHPAERGRRVVRAVSYLRPGAKDNAYAHPVEGVVAVVDLVAERVIELVDDGRDIPVPRTPHNYDSASLGPPRQSLRPLAIRQPEGPSFRVDGREGLVLHQLGWQEGERLRPILYRASVTEMVVPYADPTVNHYWKSAFDAGEYGLGKLANALELGCDCLGVIRYFDVPTVNDHGAPELLRNAICLHEEDYGTLWKHYEFRTGVFEVRRSR